jgi:hypothetical protein
LPLPKPRPPSRGFLFPAQAATTRERRRAARSQSFLRRPIASLPSAVASKKQRLCQPRHEPGTMLSFPKIRSGRIRAVKGDIEHHRMARLTNDRLEPCRDPGARPELHLPSPAAQTRIASVARIRLDSWKFVRPFKGIFCDDISEFESYHPSHAVRSLCPPGWGWVGERARNDDAGCVSFRRESLGNNVCHL